MTGPEPILNAEKIDKRFGGLCAVADFTVTIGDGEIVGLIGPNGAGKTTVFNLLTGAYKPVAAEGDILLYRRSGGGREIVVALNLGAESVSVTSSSIGFGSEIVLSTFLDRDGETVQGVLDLRGNEGVIVAAPAYVR